MYYNLQCTMNKMKNEWSIIRWNIILAMLTVETPAPFPAVFARTSPIPAMPIRLVNKNYLWLIFETTTNEFLSSDRHVIKDIIILPLLFFGFPYLFKIRQIKYPAYYTIWNDRFDAIFCNKQHFRNFVTC